MSTGERSKTETKAVDGPITQLDQKKNVTGPLDHHRATVCDLGHGLVLPASSVLLDSDNNNRTRSTKRQLMPIKTQHRKINIRCEKINSNQHKPLTNLTAQQPQLQPQQMQPIDAAAHNIETADATPATTNRSAPAATATIEAAQQLQKAGKKRQEQLKQQKCISTKTKKKG